MPCYLISRIGADVIAHKLSGEKGVLFTAAYSAEFRRMEKNERASLNQLSECNSASRLIVPALRSAGATPMRIAEFLRGVYAPLGIAVETDGLPENPVKQRTYSSFQIAKKLGVLSSSGKPHYLAVSSVISRLDIDNRHKVLVPVQYGSYSGVSLRYDDFAFREVRSWFEDAGWPDEIASGNRVFKIFYTH